MEREVARLLEMLNFGAERVFPTDSQTERQTGHNFSHRPNRFLPLPHSLSLQNAPPRSVFPFSVFVGPPAACLTLGLGRVYLLLLLIPLQLLLYAGVGQAWIWMGS